MFNKNTFLQHTTNTPGHNRMTQAGIKAPFSLREEIENPQNFRVKRIDNGRSYQFENGGSVNITEHDNDHHVIDVNHDHPSSIRAAIEAHLSKGAPTSIEINPEHGQLLKKALASTGKDYYYDKKKKRFEYSASEGKMGSVAVEKW